jgi:ATP-binding cassette, subfamily C (CFTR/MRP), member 1
LAAALVNFLRLILLYICSLRASRQMFVRLLSAVLHAPMSFFDTTPIGRIINRFSGDMNTVDSTLIETVRSYIMTLFTILSTVIVISFVTPIFTVCLIPIIAYYAIQQNYFTSTYRELKRLDSIGRSPIYALLGETLDGVTTIRAFGAQSSFSEKLCEMLDRQQHAYYLISAAQSWLGIRLEMVGTMIITFTCLACVWQHSITGGNEVFAGLAGLAISYSLSVTQSLNWSVRMASDFEANMVAVERLEQYCSIPSEAPRVTLEDSNLARHWPERGEIIFSGVKLRYRPELDLVLKGLDIHIPAGAKVGVVGRTGAGKSTLMVALLRLVELCDGRIIIDGIDHSLVGLAKLRSKIAVIPQDPVLFSGTIRSNLDPFDEFTDERLIDVLKRVGLYYGKEQKLGSSSNSLSSMAGKVSSLQDRVTDGGGDYSVGQRQLIVIARALLSESNIVVMDEATAAVDAETDKRIQKIMRHDFCHATCLTVAHRIHTITDSDYILVMSDGRAEEFDTPTNLLQKGGLFRDLVNASSMKEP